MTFSQTIGLRNASRYTVAIALTVASFLHAGTAKPVQKKDLYEIARCFELQEMAERPQWVENVEERLFSFLWLSDMHLYPGERTRIVAEAIRYGCETLQVDFGVITGDNNGHVRDIPEGLDTTDLKALGILRHRQLKTFLDETFTIPYAIIPGDNWPGGFEGVFGAFQFSFNVSGMHFLFLCPDRAAQTVEGCSVFANETWKWMVADLQANRLKPTLLFTHEPLLPPAFLDAKGMTSVLAEAPQVLATASGHLHLDLDLTVGGIRQLVCPSVGLSVGHGIKEVSVFRDRILVATHERNRDTNDFEPVKKWQKIDIPEHLRGSLTATQGTVEMRDQNEIPPHPRQVDPRLARRGGELTKAMLGFLFRMGLQGIMATGAQGK